MFQVTEQYQDNQEVGYAEGECAEDALLEVRESIPAVYEPWMVTFSIRWSVTA